MTWDVATQWAWEAVGKADLGDFRNTRRAVRMAAQALRSPGGKLSAVFKDGRELAGAYDFLENPRVEPSALGTGIAVGSAQRCAGLPFVWIVADGTSLSPTDGKGDKGFGPLGNSREDGCGIKVITTLVVDPNGTPQGLGQFEWWIRTPAPLRDDGEGKIDNGKRKVQDKETQRWLDAIRNTRKVWQQHAPATKRWWVIDREADSWPLLLETCGEHEWVTIRSNTNRRIKAVGSDEIYLREVLASQPVLDEFELSVPHGPKRTARLTRMQMRRCRVTLDMHEKWSKKKHPLTVNVLWAYEVSPAPKGEEPLDWVLLTTHPIDTVEDACLVLFSYTQRWRIEDFHRAWKSAGCCVEQSQLRGPDQLIKWAMILAVVAARAERLKLLARNEPKLAASVELSSYEITAIRALHRTSAKPRERIPRMPTIEQAVLWISQLGGYTGKSSGGPPGAMTIMRGLERLRDVALGIELAERAREASGGTPSGIPR
jgi:hypothetical protein